MRWQKSARKCLRRHFVGEPVLPKAAPGNLSRDTPPASPDQIRAPWSKPRVNLMLFRSKDAKGVLQMRGFFTLMLQSNPSSCGGALITH